MWGFLVFIILILFIVELAVYKRIITTTIIIIMVIIIMRLSLKAYCFEKAVSIRCNVQANKHEPQC